MNLASLVRSTSIATLAAAGIGAIATAWTLTPLVGEVTGLLIAAYVAGFFAVILAMAMLHQGKRQEDPRAPCNTEKPSARFAALIVTVSIGSVTGFTVSHFLPLHQAVTTVTQRAAEDMLAFRTISDAVNPVSPAVRDCSVALALTSAYRPSTGVGALSKKVALLALYTPAQASEVASTSKPCINRDQLIEHAMPLIAIAEGEAQRLRRFPSDLGRSAQLVADRTVLTESDLCHADTFRDGKGNERDSLCKAAPDTPVSSTM